MDFSEPYQCTNALRSIPSPDGSVIASLSTSSLILYTTSRRKYSRTIPLQPQFAARINIVRWSPHSSKDITCRNSASSSDDPEKAVQDNGSSFSSREKRLRSSTFLRILVADQKTVRVWDVYDEQWNATIDVAGGGVGNIANIEFNYDGNAVLVFSDFGINVTAWSLKTSRSVEIRDPKFSRKGFGYRPQTGHLALLTRPAAHDIITLHAPDTFNLLKSFTLSTIDAQDLKWSPDGKWIAAWDAASSGYKVLLYTADGHLFRAYSGDTKGDLESLGVKHVEWNSGADFLAIGDHGNRVTLLRSITFTPTAFLDHTSTIKVPNMLVWQEQVSGSGERSYAVAGQPMCPPSVSSLPTNSEPKSGISMISFSNPDGALVATHNESMPTTVWIWSLKVLTPYAVIVQHTAVKSLLWHPTIPNLLMIVTAHSEAIVYLWSATWGEPCIVKLPLQNLVGKHHVQWLDGTGGFPLGETDPSSSGTRNAGIIYTDNSRYVLGSLQLEDDLQSKGVSSRDILSHPSVGGYSKDSLSSIPKDHRSIGASFITESTVDEVSKHLDLDQSGIDDTFQHRHDHFSEAP